MHAELEALICSGPRRGRQHTYALLDDRAPQGRAVTRDEALAELVLRFFRSRGPATVRDLTTWSSLTVSDAKAGLEMVEDHLDHELDDDGTPWYAAEQPPGGAPDTADALLLPMYDEMVMGYRDLKVVLASAPPREGLLRRPVAIDGLTVGSWKRTLAKREAVVEVTLLAPLDPSATETLKGAVERFGRFLDLPGRLEAAVAE